ncbi:hypothetical protein ATANTOWER_026298, partial [Ataeniobius toweri]|nr:hypothetical protein [Ataeniobius toweri]
ASPGFQVKATVHSPAAGPAGTTAETKPKDTAKSTPITTVKAAAPKADVDKTSKPAAAAVTGNVLAQAKKEDTKTAQTKVQVEVPPSTAKPAAAKQAPAADPLDCLVRTLPSADSVAPSQPAYTGPEAVEHVVTFETVEKCGERDNTLPPEYQWRNIVSLLLLANVVLLRSFSSFLCMSLYGCCHEDCLRAAFTQINQTLLAL